MILKQETTFEMDSTYSYKPLDRDRMEIRLLQILDRRDPLKLRCCLIHASLLAAPRYEALSYTWRAPARIDQNPATAEDISDTVLHMEVNGKVLTVFDNLHRALIELSSYHRGYLWVDAICINQGDVKERENQVGLMGRIFSEAVRVVAWLGPRSSCSPFAIDFLRALAECYEEGKCPTWVLETTEGSSSLEIWTGLFNLVNRDWWRRAWIIQEYILGKDVVFLCGKDSFDAKILEQAFGILHNCWPALFATSTVNGIAQGGFNARLLDPIWNLISLRNRLRRPELPPVHPLIHLSLTRGAHATDPRDRLFAQYGIIGKRVTEFCPPNYSLSHMDVLAIFFQNYVRSTQDLSILCHAGMDGKTQLERVWPTWLPRWASDRHVYPFFCDWTGRQDTWPTFNACGKMMTPSLEIDSDKLLRCNGIIADELDGVQFDPWCKQAWEDTQGRQSASTRNIYGGPESTFEALWRTLVADTNRNFYTGSLVPCPQEATTNFGALFAGKCHEYNRLLDTQEVSQGGLPTSPVLGYSNIARRWHGMRELKLGGLRLRDVIPLKGALPMSGEVFEDGSRRLARDWENFEGSHGQVFYRRRIFTTQQGRLGVGSRSLKPGDKVCILWGCPVPLLLRRNGARFQLVGDAYVHGIMHGESISEGNYGEFDSIIFNLE